MKLLTVRASALRMGLICGGSLMNNGSIKAEHWNQEAANGTAAHAVLRGLGYGENLEADPSHIDTVAGDHGADPKATRILVYQGLKLWREISDLFHRAIAEKGDSHVFAGGFELTGTADLVAYRDALRGKRVVIIGDWKTGRVDVPAYHQLMGYAALAMATDPSVERAVLLGLWVRDQEIERYEVSRSRVADWIKMVESRLIDGDGTLVTGPHCLYCKQRPNCGAAREALRANVEALGDITAEHIPELDPSDVFRIYKMAAAIEKIAASVKDQIRQHLLNGSASADGGLERIEVREQKKRSVNVERAAVELFAHGVSREDLLGAVSLGVGAVEELLISRGLSRKEAKATLEEFEARGAISVTTELRLQTVRN
jgi:hypothetical protein